MVPFWLLGGLLATAFCYSSVGLGGGSTYIALFALADLPPDATRTAALALNLLVASIGTYYYVRRGHFQAQLLFPFVVGSIPGAYLGGSVSLSEQTFRLVLASSLLIVAMRMFLAPASPALSTDPPRLSWAKAWRLGVPLGFGLGTVAGLVGIGGGIFLGPVLIILRWAAPKAAAAASAAFVVINSATGLLAHAARGHAPPQWVLPMLAVVAVGAVSGARTGSLGVPARTVQRVFAGLIVIVCVNLISKALL